MALIKCPNCKKEISDTTKRCIHCKKRLDGKIDIFSPRKIKISIVVIIVLIIGAMSIKQIAKTFNYHKTSEKQEVKTTNIEDNNNNNEEIIDNNTENKIDDNVEEEKQVIEDTKTETTTNESKSNNNSNNKSNNNQNINKTNDNTNTSQNSNNKIVISATENKTCPSNYTLSNDKSTCNKFVYTDNIVEYYCDTNISTLVGNKCRLNKTIPTTSNGQCSGVYILENDECVRYIDANTKYTCPSGYDFANTSDYLEKKCSKIEKTSPNIEYTCPDGYTLNGTNCEK